MADTVLPGTVDWTGDNPFIYLKTDPNAQWSSLSLFFRITASAHGTGHLIIVVEDPYGEPGRPATRVAFTDNPPLARFLLDDFVRRFVLFRPSEVLDSLDWVENAEFTQQRGEDIWTEACTAGCRSAELCWHNLGDPFAVDQAPAESGTGQHEMFSVFRPATGAQVTVDGRRLPGQTVEREWLIGRAQSAALALSETWVRA